MNDDEFGSVKLLKFGGGGGSNNSHFLQNWFVPETRTSLANLKKFKNSEKSTNES